MRISDDGSKVMSWCAPDSVPDCLISKMKNIEILGFYGTEDELKLLGYILSHAIVLEEFHIDVENKCENGKGARLWIDCNLCRSLFSLFFHL